MYQEHLLAYWPLQQCHRPGKSLPMSMMCTAEVSASCPLQVFIESIRLFVEQRSSDIGAAVFDKDDDLAVEFVAAASNLRSLAYGIPTQALFDAKVRFTTAAAVISCREGAGCSRAWCILQQLSVSEHGARRSSECLQSLVQAAGVIFGRAWCLLQLVVPVAAACNMCKQWSVDPQLFCNGVVAACVNLGLIFII